LENGRFLVTSILVLSALIPLTLPQAAVSQSLTTATSIQYFTTLRPTTAYSTIQTTISYTQSPVYLVMPANYDNKTGSFSLSQVEWVSSGGSSRNGGSDNGCRYYDYFLINATVGQEIRGHFEVVKSHYEAVVRSVDLFILNLNQLWAFKGSRCGNWGGNWTSQLHVLASSYDLKWVASQSGEYALLFLSHDSYFYYNFYGEYLYFTANVYSPTVQTSLLAYTSTRPYTLQSNQIVMSTQSNINPVSSTTPYFVASVVLIIIGIISLVTLTIKRQAQSLSGPA
jgi:hypothetical protein